MRSRVRLEDIIISFRDAIVRRGSNLVGYDSDAVSCCTCCRPGFHRIRHYGLLANANRKTQIATARRAAIAQIAIAHRHRESALGRGDDSGYASCRRYSGSFIFLRNVL
jgi:hypothetical protein